MQDFERTTHAQVHYVLQLCHGYCDGDSVDVGAGVDIQFGAGFEFCVCGGVDAGVLALVSGIGWGE